MKGFEPATLGSVSYKREIVGGTTEFPAHLIASLLVVQWLYRWCPMFDSWHVLFRVSYCKWKPNHAAAPYHTVVYTLLLK